MSTATAQWRNLSNRKEREEHLITFEQMLEMHLPYMIGRSARMDAACQVVGQAMALDAGMAYALSLASRFHDIGLLGIPSELLLKNAPLTPEEEKKVQQHADIGGRLLAKSFPDFPDAMEGIWFHHERMDGTGPHGLKTGEIPITAEIVAAVGTVEAMANPRPYRNARSLPEIITELNRCSGSQLAPGLIAVILKHIDQVYERLLITTRPVPSIKTAGNGEKNTGQPAKSSVPLQRVPTIASPSVTPTGSKSTPCQLKLTTSAPPANATPGAMNPQPAVRSDSGPPSLIIGKQELARLVREGLEVKAFAVNVHNVLAVTQNPRCSAEDVAKEVALDQVLSLRVLKLSNSSVFTTGRPTNSIKAAIGRIGVREVRNIVMSLGVIQQYEGRLSNRLDPQMFWEHSIGCGLVASALGKACRSKAVDDFFLSGIVHDVGRLILLDRIPDKYAMVWDQAERMGIPMEIAEARLMGLDHSDILQQALEHWKFPRDFTLPVIHHHKPVTRIKKLAANDLEHAAVLRLADKMANALMLGNSGNEIIYPLDDLVDLMGIGEATFTQIAENTPDETQSLKLSLIARSNADIGDNLGTQKAKRLKTGVQAVVAAARLWSNPLRMFFRRLAAYAGNDEPNLGIIYLRNATEQDAVLKDYELQERKANVGVLPVLILLETGNLPVNREWVERRRHAVITMPVRIDHLIDKINHLLVDCLVSSGQARR